MDGESFIFFAARWLMFFLGGAGTTIKAHNNHVTGISLHATGQYLLSASRDKSWAFSDISSGKINQRRILTLWVFRCDPY